MSRSPDNPGGTELGLVILIFLALGYLVLHL